MVEASGAIERWDDLSGNDNHAAQAVSERATDQGDGRAKVAMSFGSTAVNDTLAVASPPSLAAGVTLFLVFAVRTRSDFSGIVSAAAATGVDHQAFFSLQNASAASGQFQWLGLYGRVEP